VTRASVVVRRRYAFVLRNTTSRPVSGIRCLGALPVAQDAPPHWRAEPPLEGQAFGWQSSESSAWIAPGMSFGPFGFVTDTGPLRGGFSLAHPHGRRSTAPPNAILVGKGPAPVDEAGHVVLPAQAREYLYQLGLTADGVASFALGVSGGEASVETGTGASLTMVGPGEYLLVSSPEGATSLRLRSSAGNLRVRVQGLDAAGAPVTRAVPVEWD
jgi:hypothetical protein